MWLLDTCVLSELSRSRPDPKVSAWIAEHADELKLSAVSFGEISFGIERMPPSAKRNALAHWFEQVQRQFGDDLMASDEKVWLRYGQLKASLMAIGRVQDELDLLIGATASVHGLTLATRNPRHFKDMGLPLTDPWK
jgi:predicted nucleic acid-binding protein